MTIVRGASVVLAEGGTSSTSLVVNVPSGIADGDVLVTFLGIGAAGLTPPGGWNLIGQATGQAVISSYIYYHVVTSAAGEPASYTWSGWTASRSTAQCVAYSGVDNTTPVDVTASTQSNAAGATTVVLASITTVTNGAMLISCAGQDSAAGTDTIPGTMSRVSDSTGTGKRFGSADETDATAGATGTRTWTFDSSVLAHSGVLGALRPATGSTPISVSDSGAGSQTLTADAAVLLAESGTGTQTLTAVAAVPLAETGSAVDALLAAVASILTDAAGGVDQLAAAAPSTGAPAPRNTASTPVGRQTTATTTGRRAQSTPPGGIQ